MTEALVATDVAQRRHWASYHRLFSSGIWDPDQLGFWLLHRLRSGLAAGALRLVIDDTLCPKKGPEVFGIGTHFDAIRSTRKHKVFCFGHYWVVLAARRGLLTMRRDLFYYSNSAWLQMYVLRSVRRGGHDS